MLQYLANIKRKIKLRNLNSSGSQKVESTCQINVSFGYVSDETETTPASGDILFRIWKRRVWINASKGKKFPWIEATRFSECFKQFLELSSSKLWAQKR